MPEHQYILIPTAYFPPISYFYFLISGKPIQIELYETFPKQTYRNRCEILTAGGKASLVVPVSKPNGNHTLTRDIQICYREQWQQIHWRAIQSAYSSSPYFSFYADQISVFFNIREQHLINLNQKIIELICRLIQIRPSISSTNAYDKNPSVALDLRQTFSPKKAINYNFKHYPQVFEHLTGFIHGLSILDLLFNTGPDAKEYLRELIF
ncbi:MAG: WbqC family protein [Bacteroidales bacterium]|nr:WbqC family protein [Bacteroidales bacterium]